MECKKCGSTKIMEDIILSDYVVYGIPKNLSVRLKKTNRVLFNEYAKTDIISDICGNCGHMELKIANPKELWETYLKK